MKTFKQFVNVVASTMSSKASARRKRQEKDNFDLYKKRQKRAAALRGDPEDVS